MYEHKFIEFVENKSMSKANMVECGAFKSKSRSSAISLALINIKTELEIMHKFT